MALGFEKKGIPMKEHLSFIIDYSLKAIETKYDNKKENKDDDADDDEDEEEEEDMENEEKKEKIAKNENKNIEQKKENKDNEEIKGEVKNGGDNDSYDEDEYSQNDNQIQSLENFLKTKIISNQK